MADIKWDKVLSGIGSVLSLALLSYLIIVVCHPIYIVVGVLSFASCLSYFIYCSVTKTVRSKRKSIWDSKYLGFDYLYLILFVSSIGVYIARPEVYSRPLSYIVFVCAMAGLVFMKVAVSRFTKMQVIITTVEIVLIGLSLEWSVTLMFPTVVGIDPWFHQSQTMRILAGETLGLASSPVMYYVVSLVMKITGLPYHLATMVSISFLQVALDTALIVGISRLIVGSVKVGLVAALLVVTANWHVFFGYWTIPNTLGATLVLGMTWCVLRWHKGYGHAWLAMGMLVFGILLFTHILAVIWAIVVIVCFVGLVLRRSGLKVGAYPLISVGVCVLGLAVFVWQSGYMNTLTIFINSGFNPARTGLTEPFLLSAVSQPLVGSMYVETLSQSPLLETLFNSMGMFLFFALSFWGCFMMVSKRKGLWWLAAGVIVLSIGFFPMLLGMSVIEHRWWYFAEMILSVPLGLFLLWVATGGFYRLMSVTVFVFCSVFLMVMGLPTNIDNRTISANQIVRYGMTNDEIEGMRIALSYGGQVGVDGYFTLAMYVFPDDGDRMVDITPYLLNGDFKDLNCDVVLLRNEARFAPISTGNASIYRLRYDPMKLLSPKYICVYENNDVLVMVKP